MHKLIVKDRFDNIIHEKEINKDVLTIGRLRNNDISLLQSNVSRNHAVLKQKNGNFYIQDLGSANGTLVNNVRIPNKRDQAIKVNDEIRIGDFLIILTQIDENQPPEESISTQIYDLDTVREQIEDSLDEDFSIDDREDPFAVKKTDKSSTLKDKAKQLGAYELKRAEKEYDFQDDFYDENFQMDLAQKIVKRVLSDEEIKKNEILLELKKEIHRRLLEYMDLRKMDFNKTKEKELREKTKKLIRDIITEMAGEIPRWVSKRDLAKQVFDEALGLGPLEDYLADEMITEVMVNNKDQIYIEKYGKITLTESKFSTNDAVMSTIERILGPIGRRIDESSPMVDARLKDGSRVNAIIPPIAVKGPCITIRRFAKNPYTVHDLIAFQTLTPKIAAFIKACVLGRKNLVISGGTGSGKTTLLNVCSGFIPNSERIVTIEIVTELQLHQEHWISLEARPPNIEGKGEITIRDLVRNSLRMRPDRIVVGECRGGESIDMIQAMNTGHDGSMTTLHSNSSQDALSRLETMVLMAGMDLPVKAIREQIISAVDIIIHTARFPDGSRKVTEVVEVMDEVDEHYRIKIKPIFKFIQEGLGERGRVIGEFHTMGHIPTFLPEFHAKGILIPEDFFAKDL